MSYRIWIFGVAALAAACFLHAATLEGTWSAERLHSNRVQLNLKYRSSNNGFGIVISQLPGLKKALDSQQTRVLFQLVREAGTMLFSGDVDKNRDTAEGEFQFQESSEFRSQMAALGYKDLSGRDLYQMAVLNVTTAYVQELSQAGYGNLSKDELIEMRIFDVDREFIDGLQARGYDDVPRERLVEMKIHGASLEFIDQLKQLGYENLPLSRLVEFRIHGVSPEFIRSIRAEGYQDVSAKQLVEMRIFGVDSGFIREAKTRHSDPSIRELIDMRIFHN